MMLEKECIFKLLPKIIDKFCFFFNIIINIKTILNCVQNYFSKVFFFKESRQVCDASVEFVQVLKRVCFAQIPVKEVAKKEENEF